MCLIYPLMDLFYNMSGLQRVHTPKLDLIFSFFIQYFTIQKESCYYPSQDSFVLFKSMLRILLILNLSLDVMIPRSSINFIFNLRTLGCGFFYSDVTCKPTTQASYSTILLVQLKYSLVVKGQYSLSRVINTARYRALRHWMHHQSTILTLFLKTFSFLM